MSKLYVLNGVLPYAVKSDGVVTPAGLIQALFTDNERETALAIAAAWYARGWKPNLFSKTYDGQFELNLFNYKFKDRAAKATKKKLAA